MTSHPIVQHRLGNGLRIVLAPDPATPVVATSMWYTVGSKDEAEGRSGFAHLFEHLMFQGSAHVGKGEHFDIVQAAGGRTNARTEWDATIYGISVPSHELELALWLEADRLATLGAALTQETLDNQREVVKNERRKKVDNQPYGSAEDRLFALAYPPTHPYHHSSWGSMEELSAASLADARAFFAAHYLPNNAVLAIAGDFDAEVAIALAERHFGPIAPGTVARATDGTLTRSPEPAAREMVDEDVPLPRLYVGCLVPPLGDTNFLAADILADLLVTGRASRLQEGLVRGRRLAQAVDAWTYPLVDGAALLVLEATAREGVTLDLFESAVNEELDRLVTAAVEDAELARMRLQRRTRRGVANERAEERADRIGMYAALLDDPDRFAREDALDEAVDSQAIGAVSRGFLGPDDRVHLWFAPRS